MRNKKIKVLRQLIQLIETTGICPHGTIDSPFGRCRRNRCRQLPQYRQELSELEEEALNHNQGENND